MPKRDNRISVFGDERDEDIFSVNALQRLDAIWADKQLSDKVFALIDHFRIENQNTLEETLLDLVLKITSHCIKGFRVLEEKPRRGRKLERSHEQRLDLAIEIDKIAAEKKITADAACQQFWGARSKESIWFHIGSFSLKNEYYKGKQQQAHQKGLEEWLLTDAGKKFMSRMPNHLKGKQ